MTEAIGAIKIGSDSSQPFYGRDFSHQREYSESVAALVDEEVRKLIENAHQEAYEILVANRDIMDRMTTELLERETLGKEEIAEIFAGIKKMDARPAWTGSPRRAPSMKPPVAIPERAKIDEPTEVVEKPKRGRKPKPRE